MTREEFLRLVTQALELFASGACRGTRLKSKLQLEQHLDALITTERQELEQEIERLTAENELLLDNYKRLQETAQMLVEAQRLRNTQVE